MKMSCRVPKQCSSLNYSKTDGDTDNATIGYSVFSGYHLAKKE